MSRLTSEMLEQVSNTVQGTWGALEHHFNESADFYHFDFEFEDLSPAEEMQLCDYIDQRYFVCEKCGWWCGDYSERALKTGNEICSACGEY